MYKNKGTEKEALNCVVIILVATVCVANLLANTRFCFISLKHVRIQLLFNRYAENTKFVLIRIVYMKVE